MSSEEIYGYGLPNASGQAIISATGAGKSISMPGPSRSFSARMVSGATPSATIEIHGFNDPLTVPSNGTRLGTITLAGADDSATLFVDSVCLYVCQKTTALSGTIAVSGSA